MRTGHIHGGSAVSGGKSSGPLQPPPLSRTAPRSLITAGCKRLVTQSNAITVFIGQ